MGVIVTKNIGISSQTTGTAGDGRSGTYDIPSGASEFTVTFSPNLSGSYQVIGEIVNTVDASASSYTHTVTSKTINTFKVDLSDYTDSINYQFDWLITVDGLSPSAVYSLDEKKAIEMEMEFIAAKANYYQEFFYTGNQLTSAGVWTTAAKIEKLFGKTLTYAGNKLTQTLLTRVSDGATLTKTFAYTGNQLTSTTVVAT